jgi:hypothetical protein
MVVFIHDHGQSPLLDGLYAPLFKACTGGRHKRDKPAHAVFVHNDGAGMDLGVLAFRGERQSVSFVKYITVDAGAAGEYLPALVDLLADGKLFYVRFG